MQQGGNVRTTMIYKTYDAYQKSEDMRDWRRAAFRLKRLESLLENVKIPPVPSNDGIYPSDIMEFENYCQTYSYQITLAISKYLKEHANDRIDFKFTKNEDEDEERGGIEF